MKSDKVSRDTVDVRNNAQYEIRQISRSGRSYPHVIIRVSTMDVCCSLPTLSIYRALVHVSSTLYC